MEHEETKERSFSFLCNYLRFFVSSCLVKIIPTYLYTVTSCLMRIAITKRDGQVIMAWPSLQW